MTTETTTFHIDKLTAVPQPPYEKGVMYIVAPTARPEYIEIYLCDKDESTLKRVFSSVDAQALIAQQVQGMATFTSVADISARDSLDTNTVKRVLVLDATADPSVTQGSASYAYDDINGQWVKTGEAESMDLALHWDNIEGKPNVSSAQLEQAVNNAHSHANKTQLDNIDEDENGNLTYNGSLVGGTISHGW